MLKLSHYRRLQKVDMDNSAAINGGPLPTPFRPPKLAGFRFGRNNARLLSHSGLMALNSNP